MKTISEIKKEFENMFCPKSITASGEYLWSHENERFWEFLKKQLFEYTLSFNAELDALNARMQKAFKKLDTEKDQP